MKEEVYSLELFRFSLGHGAFDQTRRLVLSAGCSAVSSVGRDSDARELAGLGLSMELYLPTFLHYIYRFTQRFKTRREWRRRLSVINPEIINSEMR